jgi:hypothetical protein
MAGHTESELFPGLKAIQRGRDPGHYEIVPTAAMPVAKYIDRTDHGRLERMTDGEYPKLILPDHFDERSKDEAHSKGYLSGALVQLENGDSYSVYFIDPVRLRQDLDAEVELGRPYIAEPGIVVIPEITVEKIESVLGRLLSDRFFDNLKPLVH